MMLSNLLLLATWVVSGWAAGVSGALHEPPSTSTPLPPSQDSWYVQPANISKYRPGELIRSRQIESKLQPLLPFGGYVSVDAVYQYLFRTTDSLNNPVAVITTLIIPHNSDPSKLLVYQAAYDAANADCSPSYTLRFGSASGLVGLLLPNSTVSTDIVLIVPALNQGWWVMVTDYEGLHAQFAAGLQSAYATLDSVRIVLSEGRKIGLARDVRYVMWGYSGGAIAGGWAAEIQPSYAPELQFEGAVLGGSIVNITSLIETINGGPFVGLLFRGIYGVAKAYPSLLEWMNENMRSAKKDDFFKHAMSCQIQGTDGTYLNIFDYFVEGERSLDHVVPASVLSVSGQMGLHGTPTMPLYIYKSLADQISPARDNDALVKKYCGNRATVEYHRNLIGDHVTEALTGSVNALEWVSDRLAGIPIINTGVCIIKNVYVGKINPSTIPMLGEELYAILSSLLGNGLGSA
ncbi:hypothetical protein ACO22_06937 [Paracoccidioides brasiliensis]|uniref:Secretory lipase-domain-containing protein n=1 Tax=Paracoccidioides brasiliensis TaxID=121759 RepID=A0A1D2J637_PARBR|nr:hypothetical protein ACO22_06937 [Paracoccidioides brasiliensis]